jgi:hypothetical protein
MGKEIPRISDELIAWAEELFAHGPSRAKNHDQRFGQWIVNKIRTGHPECGPECVQRVLFNLENQEFWDLVKDYNE